MNCTSHNVIREGTQILNLDIDRLFKQFVCVLQAFLGALRRTKNGKKPDFRTGRYAAVPIEFSSEIFHVNVVMIMALTGVIHVFKIPHL